MKYMYNYYNYLDVRHHLVHARVLHGIVLCYNMLRI